MSVGEHFQDSSPKLTATSTTASNFHYGSPTLSPTITSPRYDYNDYGVQQQQNLHQWNGSQSDRQSLDLGYPSPQDQMSYASPYGYDYIHPGYEPSNDMTGLSTTPPTASFAATGLPFPGLEFIRNYNSTGYAIGEQDSLWHSYDPGAFEYNPDIPFNLGDADIVHDSSQ